MRNVGKHLIHSLPLLLLHDCSCSTFSHCKLHLLLPPSKEPKNCLALYFLWKCFRNDKFLISFLIRSLFLHKLQGFYLRTIMWRALSSTLDGCFKVLCVQSMRLLLMHFPGDLGPDRTGGQMLRTKKTNVNLFWNPSCQTDFQSLSN